MNDARFDRVFTTGDAAGDAMPALGSNGQLDSGEHDVVPTTDWARRRTRARTEAPLLVHWIDEKGAVVRLISSSRGQDEPAAS